MTTTARPSRILLLAAVLLFTLAAGAPAAGGQPPDPPGDLSTEEGGPWVVRAYYDDPAMVASLAAILEPWEVHHDGGWLLAAAGPQEIQALLDLGFHLEVDAARTAELVAPRVALEGQEAGIPGYPCYRTVEETYAAAAALAAAHPDLAAWIDVGDSWEKQQPGGAPGHDLWVLRLTNAQLPGPKPKLFVLASIHAREYAPAELATRFAEHLVGGYGRDADTTWLLDHHEFHLVLQGNPDGRKMAETGIPWRKNTDSDDGCDILNGWGVDLNRNFAFQWNCCGGSSDSACSEVYHGPGPASEPETLAVQDYLRAEFPDQRPPDLDAPAPADATGVFVDLHSYGNMVLWPWGFDKTEAPNGPALQTLGRKLAYWSGARPQQAWYLYGYPTDGTTDEFAYGDLGLAAFTFEVGTSFFEACPAFENTILPGYLPALLYAAKVARTPYQTPAGPDVRDLSLLPPAAGAGATIQVRATLDDTRYSTVGGSEPTQNIAGGELYLDIPPWVQDATPIAQPLLPLDGALDAPVEEVWATLSTAGLEPGRHIVYLRGRDAGGHWGAFSAHFFYVTTHQVYLPVVGEWRAP